MPERTIQRIHYCVRKTAHVVEYSILGVLVWRLIHFEPAFAEHGMGRQIWLALMFSALYAASDEFHQHFVAGRQAAVRDVLLDTCGAALGLLVLWLGRRLQTQAA
jgi:VanZ family protein